MRFSRKPLPDAEPDWTPMIDMTFQLIAFFMVLLNFSEAEQDERIRLPESELARPSDQPLDEPRTIQLTRDGLVIFQGDEVPLESLRLLLVRERQVLERLDDKGPEDVTVIIRADSEAPTGQVQQIIEACQDQGFEQFALRLRQREVRGL
jgi:biopolymer transport protein ExbD